MRPLFPDAFPVISHGVLRDPVQIGLQFLDDAQDVAGLKARIR